MQKIRISLALVAVLIVMPIQASAAEQIEYVDRSDDVVIRHGEIDGDLRPQASDPHGLLVGLDAIRDHSLGTDILEVWTCGVSGSAASYVADLERVVTPWFEYHSRGWYRPIFVPRGDAGDSPGACEDFAVQRAGPDTEGGLFAIPGGGGYASFGFGCGFTPCPDSHSYRSGNGRSGFLGAKQGFEVTAAHEMGHMLAWPHSYTGASGDQYDNASDLMSGNYGTWGNAKGSYPEPYSTAVINFYAAGWIHPSEVYVHSGGGAQLNLTTQAGSGWKMAVIKAGQRYFTLAARVPSTYDPIPEAWRGIEVYEVERCTADERTCATDSNMTPGFRRVKPSPAVPAEWTEDSFYTQPLPHVISPGETRNVGGVPVTVGAARTHGFQVSIGTSPAPKADPPAPPSPGDAVGFADTGGHTFASDIEWLAESGITRGCNPPLNTRFCPDDVVTRGQMAAFLHRALPDLATSGSTDFRDDNGSTFESDIEWLAATGVTRGCNPPTNDRFCPDDVVTRGQMAAFLHRALPDLATSGSTDFRDDNGSTFESDIEWLAATGVTRGCNPPANDRFCPDEPVTRGAMAAFLNRALGG